MEKRAVTIPVRNYFKEKKAFPIEEFYLPTEYVYKKPDLIAILNWKANSFKIAWKEDIPILDIVAIESKYLRNKSNDKIARNSIIEAIPQSLVYQQFFYKVSIATPDGRDNHISEFLENNGIGWITVNEKEVKERIPPSKERNPFIQLIDKNIRKLGNKLVVLALGRWKFGKFIDSM